MGSAEDPASKVAPRKAPGGASNAAGDGWSARLRAQLGRLHWRLLAVNLVVLLVPIVGLEFARVYERELLQSLEADMRHQAVLTRRFVEAVTEGSFAEEPGVLEGALRKAARQTRLRIRLLDRSGEVRVDSHRDGPPEGPEPPPPRHLGSFADIEASVGRRYDGPRWSALPERSEVLAALDGRPSARTRIRAREPSVLLFLSEPIRHGGEVVGVVYVTGSTAPVMKNLYRIRERLKGVLGIALAMTGAVTLLLAWSITRPLERLARSATRIAAGEYNLPLPVEGSGEIRELARALDTMTETLRRRLRDTATFAADVAHGFKSPLTAIRGAAELLEAGAAEDPQVRARFLAGMNVEVERLDRLVSQLLELSRLEASEVHPVPLDLLELLGEVAERYENPDVRLTLRAATRVPSVLGRRDDLGIAFANLIDNALRVSAASGEVRLLVELRTQGGRRFVITTIEDDGPGVPVEHRARLFERFFTTDKEQGTGLGLPITRAVVEAIGGRVYCDDASGPPTRFVVELPALSDSSDART